MERYARIICAPAWTGCWVEAGTYPAQLGEQLVEIIRRDGVQETSDTLCSYPAWVYHSHTTRAGSGGWDLLERGHDWDTVEVDGYGLAYEYADEEPYCSWIYELHTDGVIRVVDVLNGTDFSVDAFADDAIDILEERSRD